MKAHYHTTEKEMQLHFISCEYLSHTFDIPPPRPPNILVFPHPDLHTFDIPTPTSIHLMYPQPDPRFSEVIVRYM